MRLRWTVVVAAAVALWLGSWTLLHHSLWGGFQIVDTPVYEGYGDAMRAGAVPYRDFSLEYPPGALPAFLAPELTERRGDLNGYGRAFARWMEGCGVALVLACAAVLAALRVPPLRAAAPLALVAVSPLLLGNVVLSRFDIWPATLTVAALAALLSGLDLVGAAVLAAAISAKLYPAVLAPLAFAWIWQRRGPRRAAAWAAVLVGVLAAIFLPFAVLAPGGLGHSFDRQLGRPLQIESLGAVLLVWAHHLFGLGITVRTAQSQNLVGGLARTVGGITTALEAVAIVSVWAVFARGPARAERLVVASAAAVAAFLAFGKVFSPQFMVWLVPLVPLVRGRAGVAVSALLAAALMLTQVWFPARYWSYANDLRQPLAGAVLARDLAVVAIAVLLAATLRRQASRPT